MTREEAIKRLSKYVHNSCYTIEHQEACAMAISALREQEERKSPCDLCRYNPPSSMGGKPCVMCPAAAKED